MNNIFLCGNLGRDPEIKRTEAGLIVAKLSLATTERWRDESGSKQERTDWHRVICWQGLAERVEKYCSKGSTLLVRGQLLYRTYEKDGEKRKIAEIKAKEIQLLDKTKGATKPAGENTAAQGEYKPYGRQAPPSAPPPNSTGAADDIPF